MYFRYASSPAGQHLQERLQYAQPLNLVWSVGFYGSMLVFILSLLGLGWARWAGLAASVGAWSFALMTLGAMCGPFGC